MGTASSHIFPLKIGSPVAEAGFELLIPSHPPSVLELQRQQACTTTPGLVPVTGRPVPVSMSSAATRVCFHHCCVGGPQSRLILLPSHSHRCSTPEAWGPDAVVLCVPGLSVIPCAHVPPLDSPQLSPYNIHWPGEVNSIF